MLFGKKGKDSEKYEDLIKNADIALYQAKKLGRNQVQSFKPGMNGEE